MAAADDAEPTATGWTLAEYVDPSALDALFDRYSDVAGGHWRFEFDVEQFRVVVENDGVISVYRAP